MKAIDRPVIKSLPVAIRKQIDLFYSCGWRYYRWNGTKTKIERGGFHAFPEKGDYEFIGLIV